MFRHFPVEMMPPIIPLPPVSLPPVGLPLPGTVHHFLFLCSLTGPCSLAPFLLRLAPPHAWLSLCPHRPFCLRRTLKPWPCSRMASVPLNIPSPRLHENLNLFTLYWHAALGLIMLPCITAPCPSPLLFSRSLKRRHPSLGPLVHFQAHMISLCGFRILWQIHHTRSRTAFWQISAITLYGFQTWILWQIHHTRSHSCYVLTGISAHGKYRFPPGRSIRLSYRRSSHSCGP